MVICLDTNVWIFGLTKIDPICIALLSQLTRFEVVVPNQVRAEIERNIPRDVVRQMYEFMAKANTYFDYEPVPSEHIIASFRKGLKKGDALIGGFCEWRNVSILISDNRHFLRELVAITSFKVMSPSEFCQTFDISIT